MCRAEDPEVAQRLPNRKTHLSARCYGVVGRWFDERNGQEVEYGTCLFFLSSRDDVYIKLASRFIKNLPVLLGT
jgi:hypothetical protein